jgi:LmeA-like phospholipid-binding
MRKARWIGISVAVLLVLLLVADRVGVAIAERVAGDTLESSEHLNLRPDVDIAGFPFLTQVATGKYDKITVTAHDVPVGQQTRLMVISRLTVVLHELTVSREFGSFHADTATATAVVSFGELSRTLGVELSYAGNGRIRARKTVTVAGTSVVANVTAHPELVNGALTFAGAAVDNAGALNSTVAAALRHIFDLDIPMQNVPFDIRVKSLEVSEDGITIALIGRNLSYAT